MTKLKTNLKKRRKQRKMLLKQVAAEIGVPVSTYWSFENGVEPRLHILIKLAKLFGTSIDNLLGVK